MQEYHEDQTVQKNYMRIKQYSMQELWGPNSTVCKNCMRKINSTARTKQYRMQELYEDQTVQYARIIWRHEDQTRSSSTVCKNYMRTKQYSMQELYEDQTVQYARIIWGPNSTVCKNYMRTKQYKNANRQYACIHEDQTVQYARITRGPN